MATGFNSTTAAAYLQKMYSPSIITNTVTSAQSRLMQLCKENTNGGGDSYKFMADVDDVPTGSSDFATAQNIAKNNTVVLGVGQFDVPWFEENDPWRVSGKVIAQTKGKAHSWTSALDRSMKGAMNIAGHRMSVFFYGQGWGEICQVSGTSGSTFIPKRAEHIWRIFRGMQIVFSSSLNAAGLRSATVRTVTGVDYDTGVVTLNGTMAGVSAVDDDWVFFAGDREDSATPSRRVPAGMGAWFPAARTDATITTLYGVARSGNSRLYGQLTDGTTGSKKDALKRFCQRLSAFGNAKKIVLACSPNIYDALSTEMGSNDRNNNIVELKGRGGFGFKSLVVFVDGIEASIIVDKYCDDTASYGGDPSSIEINSIGPAPHIDNDDGSTLIKISDDRGVEGRLVADWNIAPKNPGAFGRINWV